MKICIVNPKGKRYEEVVFGTIRNGETRITILDDRKNPGISYEIKGTTAVFIGWLGGKTYPNALKAKEGTEFRGFKNSKQYKMTRKEIEKLIVGKEFQNKTFG